MTDKYYKGSDQILTVEHTFKPRGYHWESDRTHTYIFDFEFRTMTVVRSEGNALKSDLMPFPAVDPDVLERMRDKLVELGGNPDPVSGPRDGGKPSLKSPTPKKGLSL